MKKKLAMAIMTATMGLSMMAGSVGAAHPEPSTKADCMGGNFAEYNTNLTDDIQRFANQGQCIKFVVTGK